MKRALLLFLASCGGPDPVALCEQIRDAIVQKVEECTPFCEGWCFDYHCTDDRGNVTCAFPEEQIQACRTGCADPSDATFKPDSQRVKAQFECHNVVDVVSEKQITNECIPSIKETACERVRPSPFLPEKFEMALPYVCEHQLVKER